MPVCGHRLCKKCFKNNFKKEEGIKYFNCPTCGEPDFFKLSNQAQYMYLKLFIEMVRMILYMRITQLFPSRLRHILRKMFMITV